MATLTGLINAVSEPAGLWAIIIKAFESGVGSYILAVLLLTLIIRVVWAPVDTVNKKFNKKMVRGQVAIQPQLQKLEKQYAKDPQKLQQKKQELMKKANAGLGGGCLFMVLFMALNLTIFGTMFTTMNGFSSYKVYEQYEETKYAYANVLNLLDKEKNADLATFEGILDDYKNISVEVKTGKIYLVDKDGNKVSAEYDFVQDFSVKEGDKVIATSTSKIAELVHLYTADDGDKETPFGGDTLTANETKYSTAIQAIAMKYVDEIYQENQSENSFLWIGNIWVADSPFKQSVLDYAGYEGLVGVRNIEKLDENDTSEKIVYESFMNDISSKYNRTNGYFILAVISIGITYLSMWISNGIKKKKTPEVQGQNNKVMMIVMPLIMGVFAIFYNSVFAFYLVVSQAISTLIAPLQNYLVDKWEARDIRKEEEKNTVDYSRTKI